VNEEALRAIVRDTLARIAARDGSEAPPPMAQPLAVVGHSSHYRYTLPPSGGPCVIEPGVPCNHCGYCQSHGH
jgi:hypothetical protein